MSHSVVDCCLLFSFVISHSIDTLIHMYILVAAQGWLLYVNQHKYCQITFWPASVALALAKMHHWWYVIILIATQWLIVAFTGQFVTDVDCLSYPLFMLLLTTRFQLRVLWNDVVCKWMYLYYPLWLIVVCSLLHAVAVCCLYWLLLMNMDTVDDGWHIIHILIATWWLIVVCCFHLSIHLNPLTILLLWVVDNMREVE